MKKDIADKWIAELRSGKWKQGKGYLHDKARGEYCCLGVLAEGVLGMDCGANEVLTPEMKDAADMKTLDGSFDMGRYLSECNDNGVSFLHIADIIERRWEYL